MDNYATHKTPAIRKWLGARPRWHVHFTPTASSWVNLVERFFADITEKQIRRGVHRSTAELETAIRSYIDAVNEDPKPFRWTKSADDILATIKRFASKHSKSPPLKPKSQETQNQDTSSLTWGASGQGVRFIRARSNSEGSFGIRGPSPFA